MKKDTFERAKSSPLFVNMPHSEFEKTMNCLQVKKVSYRKKDIVWLAGESTNHFGLLISGSVSVFKDSADGNAVIIGEVVAPDFLGEIGVMSGLEHYPVSVQAGEGCEVIFLDSNKSRSVCESNCLFHKRMIEAMLLTIANKAVMLDQKVEIYAKRTIRERLLSFLDIQRRKHGNKFTSPYNRDDLARYLSVNRSALSKELSKMRDEGLIRYSRNEFEIL